MMEMKITVEAPDLAASILKLAEAIALSFADNSDAKLETIKEALNSAPEENMDWLGYNRLLESNIRRTSK